MARALPWILPLIAACGVDPPAGDPVVLRALFDPQTGAIPKPTDLLRDADLGHLVIPAEPEDLAGKTPAEAALIRALNQRDGWPRTLKAEVEISGPLDPASVTKSAIRIFEIDEAGNPRPLDLPITGEPARAPTKVTVAPPEGGWQRGRTYLVIALGGTSGLAGQNGEPVVADAAFYFLRAQVPLTDHVRALPGTTQEERRQKAEDLERIRLELAPWFAHAEKLGLARDQIVSLWSFTASDAVEVVMDKDAGRMPLPSDFLRDPATGLIDIPARDDDTALERNAKVDLARLDGFALSADLLFDLSGPFDPATLPGAVHLFALPEDGPPVEIPISAESRRADTAVVAKLPEHPLAPATDHLVIVTRELRDGRGRSVAPMLPGMLALLDAPLYDGTRSLVASVDDESAARVEPVRAAATRGLAAVERAGLVDADQVAVAWPFHTMSVYAPMRAARDAAELVDLSPDPIDVERVSPIQAALDFPLSALTLLRVGDVYEGTILTTDFLDPLTRKNREDGSWEPREIKFVMTVPASHDPGSPLPVVIFGHGLMTERRFVLALGDALAAEGLAAISIDLPYHGARTHCVLSGPQCLVNPLDQSGPLICPAPCQSGTTCAPDGRCVDNAGEGNALQDWPIVGFPQASGGAFVDVDNMVGTRDHFYQAVTDLSALERSLMKGDWERAIGSPIDPSVRYIGQSLGGIIGAVFAAVHPEIQNVVLNVPGADMIDMFRQSVVFKPHFDAFLAREMIEPGSAKHDQILNIARWIMDPIDPQTFADFLLGEPFEPDASLVDRRVLIQMATLDLVIPNEETMVLEHLSTAPREDYLAEHGFIVIPVEPAYPRGTREAAALLARGEMP